MVGEELPSEASRRSSSQFSKRRDKLFAHWPSHLYRCALLADHLADHWSQHLHLQGKGLSNEGDQEGREPALRVRLKMELPNSV